MQELKYPSKRSTLAKAYRVSPNTFTSWLRDIDINHAKILTPADLKRIKEHYGVPGMGDIKV
jgi:hypothetical protein